MILWKRAGLLPALVLLTGWVFLPPSGYTLDFPHSEGCGIVCYSCHDLLSEDPSYMPPWTRHEPQDIDDTQFNTLCWSCHNDIVAPYASTHSSLTTSEKYGDADGDGQPGWSMECLACHDPHFQSQFRTFGSEAHVHENTVTAVTATVITSSGAGWTDDEFQGLVVVPNLLEPGKNYRVVGNTSETLTTADPMDLGAVSVGDSFALIYGGAIRSEILTPSSGFRETRFFRCDGPCSFADGDTLYNGICEVCHTQTEHFRNDGGGPDQDHASMGAVVGTNCCTCHNHSGGFTHGGGEGATGCDACHGHDDGFGGGTYYGTVESHSTHTENDADDAMGPALACGDCHDTGAFPYFTSGTDADGDGRFDLWETDVCDTCHSPGGTYDGVDDSAIGARTNWEGGVYSGFAMKAGKEKWCAGCHDEAPSIVGGITAPSVVGDESGAYAYGTGWGYYKTGHGLPAGEFYPASGGITAGAGVGCDGCHDFSTVHVDGQARTFDDGDSDSTDPMYYRQGYRLDLTGGLEPMEIPWAPTYNGGSPNGSGAYRLCASCHAIGPLTDAGDMNTNFVSEGADGVRNRHVYHLILDQTRYPSDWSGVNNSKITCVNCHNVHGSTQLAMVRDGKLTGREPGLRIWYNNDDLVIYNTGNPDPPDPENLPLSASTGVVWSGGSSGNLCSHCHTNNNTVPEYRTPYQDVSMAPTLSWTGENSYETDGVNPDSAAAESAFAFRVVYRDVNNDPPTAIQVWVDRNDDGDYDDPGERVDMSGVLSGDSFYVDGRLYAVTLPLVKAGDNTLPYRFYASDGTEATGPPTTGGEVTVLNNPPVLSWTGDEYYLGDGVNPDSGGDGAQYEFRVTYSDGDDEAPASIQAWIDTNDDGDYDDAGEGQDMILLAGGNGDFTDGESYTMIMAVSYAGNGALNYTFRASDGTDFATSDAGPLADSMVTVAPTANNPPSLDWASADCLTEGVRPGTGADGADFEFMVRYTDPDNECPVSAGGDIVVWIDEDDSGVYDAGEDYALEETDPGDTDCTDGKVYSLSRSLTVAGDGNLPYTFTATDGTDGAAGDPTSDQIVTVASATKVRPLAGTGWETSILTAVNNNTGLILVYPNADFTAAVYPETFINGRPDRTIRAVCGPDLTVIDGVTRGIMFQNSSNIEIDGFTLTGSTNGIQVNGGHPVTIRNSKIYGNSSSGFSAGTAATIVISGCEIYSNGPSPMNGGGLFLNTGTDTTISDTIIRDNSTSGPGGGIFIQNATASISGTSIRNNDASNYGGGVGSNNSVIDFDRCDITGNTSSLVTGGGGGIYINNNTVSLRRCEISGNSASGSGGGMYQTGTPNVSLENCLLVDNEANRGGGAYINDDETATLIVNTTVADNRALGGEGGAYHLNCAEIIARNSIFWNNSATGVGQTVYKGGCAAADSIMTDSIATSGAAWIYGGTWITSGNIDPALDPMFIGSGDYHLQGNSPAIDAANATHAPAEDIDGDPRPQGAADDIGADEYVP